LEKSMLCSGVLDKGSTDSDLKVKFIPPSFISSILHPDNPENTAVSTESVSTRFCDRSR
jgi:hypothetical protein